MIELQKKTVEDFMGLYIDIWQFLYLPSNLRIKKKERDFMIHTLTLNAKGIDISSQDYVNEMIVRMNLNKANEVYNYRARLKRKGFLSDDTGKLTLPKALNISEVPETMFFRFKVICEEPTLKKTKQLKNIQDDRPTIPVYESPAEQPPNNPQSELQPKLSADRSGSEKNADPGEYVVLPRREERTYGAEGRSGVRDPVKELSQLAGNLAKQQKNNIDIPESHVSEATEIRNRRSSGFSSESYEEFNRQRDQSKLPPIPGMDGDLESHEIREQHDNESYGIPVPGSLEKREGTAHGVRKKIIDLDN